MQAQNLPEASQKRGGGEGFGVESTYNEDLYSTPRPNFAKLHAASQLRKVEARAPVALEANGYSAWLIHQTDQLIETSLVDQLKHFRSCIKGLATISQRPTLPRCYTSLCQALLLYPGGRESCGFEVRPKLMRTERVITCLKQFPERGSGLRVDMSRPCLLLEAVADTPDCET